MAEPETLASRYNFRPQRRNSAVGFRREQWQTQLDESRDVVAFGKFELEALKFANELQQQEETLRQQLRKEQAIASATNAVRNIDPADPSAVEKYTAVMLAHPDAQDSPFLRDNFNRIASVNKSYIESQIAKDMENLQTQNKRALATEDDARRGDWQKSQDEIMSARVRYQSLENAARLGIDATKFITPEKQDWGGLAVAYSENKNGLPQRPDDRTMNRYSELRGTVAGLRAKVNPKNPAPMPELITAEEELNSIERLYPLLAPPKVEPPAAPAPVSNLPTIKQPGAPATVSTPTPNPKPPQAAIEFLLANPDTRPMFEQRFGPADTYFPQQ